MKERKTKVLYDWEDIKEQRQRARTARKMRPGYNPVPSGLAPKPCEPPPPAPKKQKDEISPSIIKQIEEVGE